MLPFVPQLPSAKIRRFTPPAHDHEAFVTVAYTAEDTRTWRWPPLLLPEKLLQHLEHAFSQFEVAGGSGRIAIVDSFRRAVQLNFQTL